MYSYTYKYKDKHKRHEILNLREERYIREQAMLKELELSIEYRRVGLIERELRPCFDGVDGGTVGQEGKGDDVGMEVKDIQIEGRERQEEAEEKTNEEAATDAGISAAQDSVSKAVSDQDVEQVGSPLLFTSTALLLDTNHSESSNNSINISNSSNSMFISVELRAHIQNLRVNKCMSEVQLGDEDSSDGDE